MFFCSFASSSYPAQLLLWNVIMSERACVWMLLSALTACLVLRYFAVVVFASCSCHSGHGFTIFVVFVVAIAFSWVGRWNAPNCRASLCTAKCCTHFFARVFFHNFYTTRRNVNKYSLHAWRVAHFQALIWRFFRSEKCNFFQ